jgi:hypothetical protein
VRWLRRIGLGLVGLAALYLGLLAVGGAALEGCVERRVADRLARALDAEVEIGATSVSLWRGEIVLEDVRAVRREGGLVELDVRRIEADLAGWGAMLFDREVERCAVDRLVLRLSARGIAEVVTRERQPLHLETLELRDATITIMPTAVLPALGRLELSIAHARARDVELSHGLSWLSGLRELTARAVVPGGVEAGVAFVQGELTLSGAFLGAAPIRVPFRMPTVERGAYELDHLKAIAKEILRTAGKVLLEKTVRDKLLESAWKVFE